MNTRINFTKLEDGIPIVNKPIKKILWDSSFMDLYNYADVINIHNIGRKNRLITFTFNDQNIFPDWICVKQNITIVIDDVELNLKTRGITTLLLGTFPLGKKEYYDITKEYFNALLRNVHKVDDTNIYKINDNLSVSLDYNNGNSKGQISEFYFRIIRENSRF